MANGAILAANAASEATSSSSRWRGRIAVSCRVRPLLDSEADRGVRRAPWVLTDRTIALGRRSIGRPSTAPAAGRELGERTGPVTAMDAVFGERVTTRQVYERAFREIVAGAAEGLNGAIMAYGQTSSGKTYSISGASAPSRSSSSTAPSPIAADEVPYGGGGSPREKGIIHYALEDLFSQLSAKSSGNNGHTFGVYMSYCEVYMERANDLLRDSSNRQSGQNLPVKEDAETRSFYVEGLREKAVSSAEDVIAMLAQAEKRRRVACTRYNEVSSRSHTILTLVIECSSLLRSSPGDLDATGAPLATESEVTKVGRLVFVDLAGNERVEAGAEYMAEGNSINKSLFFLGKVIERLAASERRGTSDLSDARGEYLPVRDSNLTRLLSTHLGGNSRTGLLVTLTPSLDSVEESLSTLRFAQKASIIRSVAQPVFISKEQSLIYKQQEKISHLRHQVQELREWQRQQQERDQSSQQSTPGPTCRVVQQLREENSRLRSSIRHMVGERSAPAPNDSTTIGSGQQNEPQDQDESTCKRSDGTGEKRSDGTGGKKSDGAGGKRSTATREKLNVTAAWVSEPAASWPPNVTISARRDIGESGTTPDTVGNSSRSACPESTASTSGTQQDSSARGDARELERSASDSSLSQTIGANATSRRVPSGAGQHVALSTPSADSAASEQRNDPFGGHAMRLLMRLRGHADSDGLTISTATPQSTSNAGGSSRSSREAVDVAAQETSAGRHTTPSSSSSAPIPASSEQQPQMGEQSDSVASHGVGVGNPLRADRLADLCLARPPALESLSRGVAPSSSSRHASLAAATLPAHWNNRQVTGLSHSASVPSVRPSSATVRPSSASSKATSASRPSSAPRRRMGCSRPHRGSSAGRAVAALRRT